MQPGLGDAIDSTAMNCQQIIKTRVTSREKGNVLVRQLHSRSLVSNRSIVSENGEDRIKNYLERQFHCKVSTKGEW